MLIWSSLWGMCNCLRLCAPMPVCMYLDWKLVSLPHPSPCLAAGSYAISVTVTPVQFNICLMHPSSHPPSSWPSQYGVIHLSAQICTGPCLCCPFKLGLLLCSAAEDAQEAQFFGSTTAPELPPLPATSSTPHSCRHSTESTRSSALVGLGEGEWSLRMSERLSMLVFWLRQHANVNHCIIRAGLGDNLSVQGDQTARETAPSPD